MACRLRIDESAEFLREEGCIRVTSLFLVFYRRGGGGVRVSNVQRE